MDNEHLDPSTIHHVTLYKDVVYDDYGFSLSDGLFSRGVFVNRIRRGGPADIVGRIKPFDRILQVCINYFFLYSEINKMLNFK